MHAHIYGAAHAYLSTGTNRHDAASAIVNAALRTIVQRLAASSSPRTAVLHSLPQLDRLQPGSRTDARKFALIPRRRGDIHPDLTAAVLQFTIHSAAPSGRHRAHSCSNIKSALGAHPLSSSAVDFACSLGRLFRSRSRPELRAELSHHSHSPVGGIKALFSKQSQASNHASHASSCSLATAGTSAPLSPRACLSTPLAEPSAPTAAQPAAPSPTQQPSQPSKMCRVRSADILGAEGASRDTLGLSTETCSTTHSDKSGTQCGGIHGVHRGTGQGTRRWQLLQTHVSTMAQEQTLRRQLWGSAVSLALSQHTGEGSSGVLGGSGPVPSPPYSEGGHSSSSRDSLSPAESPKCCAKGTGTPLHSERAVSISSWDFDEVDSNRSIHGA